jgi:DNA-binding transcriptional MerR regulator
MADKTLSIGQLAGAAGVNVQTVRYYERRGLLSRPSRRPSGQRVYSAEAVGLLRTIKQAQRVGFTLKEIEDLLRLSRRPANRPSALQEKWRAKIAEVEDKIEALSAMRETLLAAMHSNCDALDHCTDESCPFWTLDDSRRREGTSSSTRAALL